MVQFLRKLGGLNHTMNSTWSWTVTPALKTLEQTELYQLFKLPKFRVILPKGKLYAALIDRIKSLDIPVEQLNKTKVRADLGILACDLGVVDNHFEWLWYSTCQGGSAVSLGPTFMIDPKVVAQNVGFWLPLEQWCRFPQKQLDFKKGFTLTFLLDDDTVPIKTKREWIIQFLTALYQYKQPFFKKHVEIPDEAPRKVKDGKSRISSKSKKRREITRHR